MNSERPDQELTPNAELAALLRAAEPEPRLGAAEEARLRSALHERAAPWLAARRRAKRRARWAYLPLAAAAAAAAFWFGVGERSAPSPAPVAAISAEQVLLSDLPTPEFARWVSGGADPAAWLQLAVADE